MLGHPTGIFSCACGFVYARSGPDAAPEDQWRRGKVIQYGPLWEDALRESWTDATLSINSIAQQLGVDPLTVKRQAVRLGLSLERQHAGNVVQLTLVKPLCQPTPNQSNTGDSQSYRAAWLSTRRQHPDCGTKALRALVPQTYTWLYRHDKAWLQTHLPLGERVLPRPRVDWAERDKELAGKIAIAATALKQADSHLIQVTVAALGRAIEQLALLQQHLDKLPLTAQVLTEVVETREAFALRRLQWAVKTYLQESRCPKRWELIRRAGLERVVAWPSIQQELQANLSTLQYLILGEIKAHCLPDIVHAM